MRLFVTGGADFIGSNFIRYRFARYPDDQIVNDVLTYAADIMTVSEIERDHGSNYSFVRADISDIDAISRALKQHRSDAIVNFPAESHNSRAVLDPMIFADPARSGPPVECRPVPPHLDMRGLRRTVTRGRGAFYRGVSLSAAHSI
jgi:dTDP-D-glucose 4,6-dehydratase